MVNHAWEILHIKNHFKEEYYVCLFDFVLVRTQERHMHAKEINIGSLDSYFKNVNAISIMKNIEWLMIIKLIWYLISRYFP